MVDTLQIGIWLDLGTAAFFLYVAYRVHQVSRGPGRIDRALRTSQAFWIGTAVFMVLDGGYGWAASRFDWQAPWHTLALTVRRIVFVVGLAALVHLLVVLQSRSDRHVPALVGALGVVIVGLEVVSLYQNPATIEARAWHYELMATRDTPLALNMAIGLVLFGPVFVAAVGLMRLYPMQSREGRFRLGVLSVLTAWFPAGVLIGFWDNDWYWYGVFENRVAFSAALGMLLAIRPPWLLRRRGFPVIASSEELPSLTVPERSG